MKYCPKCGTQMSDETVLCPKCPPPQSTEQRPPITIQEPLTKKNSNKNTLPIILMIINIVLTVALLTTSVIMYFNPLSTSSPTNVGDKSNTNIYNTTCPASQHGNHDWAPAKCTEPAQCYNCDAYRDDKLGEHSFYTDDDGFCDCSYCGILYDVYIASLDD